jgi:DNA-binding winged helix-turn-helix (wHTH) protein
MVVDAGTITSHIKRIRRKLLTLDPEFDAIESVYGMGYRWRTQAPAERGGLMHSSGAAAGAEPQ